MCSLLKAFVCVWSRVFEKFDPIYELFSSFLVKFDRVDSDVDGKVKLGPEAI